MANFPIVGLPFSSATSQDTLNIDQDPSFASYTTASNTTGFTLTAAQVGGSGSQESVIRLTGTLGSGQNVQFPTAASLIPLLPTANISSYTGYVFTFTIINSSGGAFSWTLTTNTGVTLNPTGTGSVTIAQNAQRVFLVTVTSQSAVTVQDISP